jgi:hypothetical protein
LKLYRHAVTIRNVKTHKLTVNSSVDESRVDLVEDDVISIFILAQNQKRKEQVWWTLNVSFTQFPADGVLSKKIPLCLMDVRS